MQAERDWKDVDAEVDVVPLDDAPAEQADSSTPVQADVSESTDIQPLEQLEDATSAGNGITDNETSAPPATAQTEAAQQTLKQDLGLATGSDQDSPQVSHSAGPAAQESTSDTREEHAQAVTSPSSNDAVAAKVLEAPGDGDQYANAWVIWVSLFVHMGQHTEALFASSIVTKRLNMITQKLMSL